MRVRVSCRKGVSAYETRWMEGWVEEGWVEGRGQRQRGLYQRRELLVTSDHQPPTYDPGIIGEGSFLERTDTGTTLRFDYWLVGGTWGVSLSLPLFLSMDEMDARSGRPARAGSRKQKGTTYRDRHLMHNQKANK